MPDLEYAIEHGGAIKILAEEPGRLRIGGYAVLYGTPATADMSPTKDYFTAKTDYGLDVANKGRVRWQHGLDPAIGRAVLGLVDFKSEPDDIGLWAEGWMRRVADYEKKVAEWVKEGRTGFSTGVAPHCVGRKSVDGAHEITEWPLGADVSITLIPADPRQVGQVRALKSLLEATTTEHVNVEADAAKSLAECSSRLVADLGEIVPRFERAHAARLAEGRYLTPEKRALADALKGYALRLGAVVDAATPRPDQDALDDARREADALLAMIT